MMAIKKIQQILFTIDEDPQSRYDVIQCFNRNMFFTCSFAYQTCVIDRTNNQIKGSPPCQEFIERAMLDPVCTKAVKFLIKMHRLFKLCPTLFTGERLNLKAYPRKDMHQMESCQMNSEGLFQFILIKYESFLAVSFKERVASTYFCYQCEKGAIDFLIFSNCAFYSVSLKR